MVAVKGWDELTEQGQYRRLRAVAFAALEDYSIEPRRLSLVGGFTNVIFRVDAAEGTFALRVDLFQDHSDTDADIELGWIEGIAADTDVSVARPKRTADGRLYTHASAEGVPGERRCTLFGWVPGVALAKRVSTEQLHRLGALSAMLHDHGQGWTPPTQPMPWDRPFYWPEAVDPYVLDLPKHAHHFDAERRSVIKRAVSIVEPMFAEVVEGAQLVHGDLHLENVHVAHSTLWAIDFEDVMWAHPVQDVAITLYYVRSEPEPEALRAAFRSGYESVRPWPETRPRQVDAFIAARELMFINFVLNVLDDPSEFYDNVFPRLRAFVETWDTAQGAGETASS